MAIAYKGNASSTETSTTTTHTVSMPSFVAGDVVVVAVKRTGAATQVTPPSEFTELGHDYSFLSVSYRVMQSGDATTYDWTSPVATTSRHLATCWSGVSNTQPIDANGGVGYHLGVSAVNIPCGVVHTKTNNAVAIGFWGMATSVDSYSFSTPSGWSNRVQQYSLTQKSIAVATAGTATEGSSNPEYDFDTIYYLHGIIALRAAGNELATPTLDMIPLPGNPAAASPPWLSEMLFDGTEFPGGDGTSIPRISAQNVSASGPTVGIGTRGAALEAGANSSATLEQAFMPLPDDFGTMKAGLKFRYSTAERVSPNDYVADLGYVAVDILKAGGGRLAGYSSGHNLYCDYFDGNAWGGTNIYGVTSSAPGYDKINTFDYVDTTATKADWDGAYAAITFFDGRQMGSDSAAITLVAFRLEGTYTVAATPSMPPRQPNSRHRHLLIR